jgi:hypothetical protein
MPLAAGFKDSRGQGKKEYSLLESSITGRLSPSSSALGGIVYFAKIFAISLAK